MAEIKDSPVLITESSIEELRKLLREEPGTLFAILDACDEPRVLEKVQQLGSERAASLFQGKAKRDYSGIAPYLVQVDQQLLDWIVENLWDDPWGIFVVAESKLVDLRKHFRRFLIVKNPDDRNLLFRFYDPRVLLPFLNSCTSDQCAAFMGAVSSYLSSHDDQGFVRIQRIPA